MNAGAVLDASAILALILDEEGRDAVGPLLRDARISAVNWSEVAARLTDRGLPSVEVEEILADLNLEVVPFDARRAVRAGVLRGATRSAGLSLGDRACLALALEQNRAAITTDRAWAKLDVGVSIRLLR